MQVWGSLNAPGMVLGNNSSVYDNTCVAFPATVTLVSTYGSECSHTLRESGEGVVNDGDQDSMGEKLVALPVHHKHNVWLPGPLHQHISPVHVPVLKLECLKTASEQDESDELVK